MASPLRRLWAHLGLAPACAALLAGCGGAIPTYTVQVAPRVADVRPPRSVVFLETEVPLAPLQAALQGAAPPALRGQGSAGPVGLSYDLRPEPPRLSATPEGLRLSLGLSGPVQAQALLLRCGEARFSAGVALTLRPSLSPAGELVLQGGPVAVQIGALRCAGVAVPLEPLLRPALEQLGQRLLGVVQLLRVPLGPAIREGLDALAAPRELRIAGERACLDLGPQGFVLAPLAGQGERLQVRIGADVAPRLALLPCSGGAARARSGDLLVQEAAAGQETRLQIAVAIPHRQVQEQLLRALRGRRLGRGARSVVVEEVEVGDQAGRLLLRLGVSGALRGSLYLWGTPTPVLVAGRVRVGVPDLRVAVETDSLLAKAGLAAWQLWDGGLPALLQRELVLDVSDQLAAAQAALAVRVPLLGRVALEVRVAGVQPETAESRPGLLVVYALLRGQLRLVY